MNKKTYSLAISIVIEWVLPVVIWLIYSNISINQFITNHNLQLCGILGIILLSILNLPQLHQVKTPLVLIITNLGYLVVVYLLSNQLDAIIIGLLIVNLIGADLLASNTIINDPYSKWVTFSLVNGIGIVVAARMLVSNFLTNNQLLLIVILIFANLLFSYPRFISKLPNWKIIGAIWLILLLTELMLGLTLQQFALAILTTTLFILLEQRISSKFKKGKWYVAVGANLIFALALVL